MLELESGYDTAVMERRRQRRIRLHWRIAIQKAAADPRVISAITEDLSSYGFRCLLEEPMRAGDTLACILTFPTRSGLCTSRALRCQASVVWVRGTDDGRFGVGCRIDDYRVVP